MLYPLSYGAGCKRAAESHRAALTALARGRSGSGRPLRRACLPSSFLPALAAILSMLGATSAPAQDLCPGETEMVAGAEAVDSRTIKLADGRSVRLAGVEPIGLLLEDAHRADTEVVKRLTAIVQDVPLRAAFLSKDSDRYDRRPAIVTTGGGIVQEALLREGLAVLFTTTESLPCLSRFLAAEDHARKAKRGFWNESRVAPATPGALTARVGRFAIFEGAVRSVGNRRARTYLNFGSWWKEDVTVEIAAPDRARFGGETALAALAQKMVRVRGFLEEKDGPMMVITSPAQLEVLGNANDRAGIEP
jgi:micrococcal nuclease